MSRAIRPTPVECLGAIYRTSGFLEVRDNGGLAILLPADVDVPPGLVEDVRRHEAELVAYVAEFPGRRWPVEGV